MDEEDLKEYRWESGYEKTWEVIEEGNDGLLEPSVAQIIQRNKRKRQDEKKNTRLGMMRHVYFILDCSEAMSNQDLKPTRHIFTLKLLEGFVEEFFDQNPISQLGLLIMRNKRAENISDLAGNCQKHIKSLQSLVNLSLNGEPSLKNGLDYAFRSLKLLPSHASREIIIIMGSLTTCDPGSIHESIELMRSEGIRCSVIGLAADILICRQLSVETGGLYGVILDETHYKELLYQHLNPPPATNYLDSSLIKMGFPHHITMERKEEVIAMCMCHLDSADDESKFTATGYHCPQCYSKYCELPVECRTCSLTLVSAPHLARSYHHLFPVDSYVPVTTEKVPKTCYACQESLEGSEKNVYKCLKCEKIFCIDCDIFIHDVLHICPGCSSNKNPDSSVFANGNSVMR